MSKRQQRNYTVRIDSQAKYEITSQGFLVADAYFTRSGVFDYPEYDMREYRPEDEVFKPESMNSLKLNPVTVEHPTQPVNVENNSLYQVGITGEDIIKDENYVAGKIIITDKDTIDWCIDCWRKKKDIQLSCGYDCILDFTPGVHHSEGTYDAIQRDIKYNHVALLNGNGRAGPDAKLRMDQKGLKTIIIK